MDDLIAQNIPQVLGICDKMKRLLTKREKMRNSEPKEISTGLFIGNYSHAIDEELLHKFRITLVVSCLKIDQRDKKNGVEFVEVLVRDREDEVIVKYFGQVFNKLDQNIKKGGICLVNCFSGKSRSPALVLSYLIRKNGMDFDQAFNYIKDRYPSVEPNRGFISQLKQYAEQIKFQHKLKFNKQDNTVKNETKLQSIQKQTTVRQKNQQNQQKTTQAIMKKLQNCNAIYNNHINEQSQQGKKTLIQDHQQQISNQNQQKKERETLNKEEKYHVQETTIISETSQIIYSLEKVKNQENILSQNRQSEDNKAKQEFVEIQKENNIQNNAEQEGCRGIVQQKQDQTIIEKQIAQNILQNPDIQIKIENNEIKIEKTMNERKISYLEQLVKKDSYQPKEQPIVEQKREPRQEDEEIIESKKTQQEGPDAQDGQEQEKLIEGEGVQRKKKKKKKRKN